MAIPQSWSKLALSALTLTAMPIAIGAQDAPKTLKKASNFRLHIDTQSDRKGDENFAKIEIQAEADDQDGIEISITADGVKLNGKELRLGDVMKTIQRAADKGNFELADIFSPEGKSLASILEHAVQSAQTAASKVHDKASLAKQIQDALGAVSASSIPNALQGQGSDKALKHLREAQNALRQAMRELGKAQSKAPNTTSKLRYSQRGTVRLDDVTNAAKRAARASSISAQRAEALKRISSQKARIQRDAARAKANASRAAALQNRYLDRLARIEVQLRDRKSAFKREMNKLKSSGDVSAKRRNLATERYDEALASLEKERTKMVKRLAEAQGRANRAFARAKDAKDLGDRAPARIGKGGPTSALNRKRGLSPRGLPGMNGPTMGGGPGASGPATGGGPGASGPTTGIPRGLGTRSPRAPREAPTPAQAKAAWPRRVNTRTARRPSARPATPSRSRSRSRSPSRSSGAHEHPELWRELQSLRRELEKVRREMGALRRNSDARAPNKPRRSKVH